jgi:hypothetical protein
VPLRRTAAETWKAMNLVNLLYYDDNLDILRPCVKDETVDSVCLDPPFKVGQSYSLVFAEQDARRAAAHAGSHIGHIPCRSTGVLQDRSSSE